MIFMMNKYDTELDLNTENSLSLIVEQLRENSEVLEFGPATGRLTKYMQEALSCQVDIVEIDPSGFERAVKYARDGVLGDIETMEWEQAFAGRTYDFIIFADVLEHLRDPGAVLAAVKKYLKKDARILMSVPNVAHNSIVYNLLHNEFQYNAIGLLDETHIHLFTYHSLQKMVRDCGYGVTREQATYIKEVPGEFPHSLENLGLIQRYVMETHEYGEVYQFVFTLSLSACQNRTSEIAKYRKNAVMTLFYRNNEGEFCETESLKYVYSRMEKNRFQFEIHFGPEAVMLEEDSRIVFIVPKDTAEIRIDPIEDEPVVLQLHISSGEYGNVSFHSNGIAYMENRIYADDDAQIIFSTREHTKYYVDLSFCLDTDILEAIETGLRDCVESRRKISLLEQECQRLQQDLTSVAADYDKILHSTFWKMTKPFRVAADSLKKIKSIRYAGKVILGVRRDGVKETGRRVLNKLSRTYKNQHYRMNAIAVEEVPESILFSILIPLYNTEPVYLKELLDSVVSQTYSNWELCLGDASTENVDAIRAICQDYQGRDERIHYFRIEHNEGISENTNICAQKAQGEYIVLCDHDDIMDKEALRANAWMIQHTEADVLYSDEDHIDAKGNHFVPLFKPDWSPDLLRSQMYTCHLFVFRRVLFEELGGFKKEYDGSQDYDLMLRFSEKTDKIAHIPMILYSWREIETSTAANVEAKPYAQEAGRSALDAHLKRIYGENAYAENREHPFLYEANYGLVKQEKPLVSIIIPMKDQCALSRQCIDSILEKTSYQNFEILLLNNRSEQEESYQWFESVQKKSSKIRVFDADFDFNWSKLNNFGMEHAKGDVFVFLNNDTLVISPDWLDKLCDHALRDDIGVVGPMLLYEDNTIQHAGIVVGMGGWADHVYKGMRQEHYASPYISSMVSRNVMAVTGACMVVSRKTIGKIGKFDEEFIICGSDVELCIRAYNSGLNNLYHAGVKLYHLESKSRDSYIPEIDFKKSYQCYTMCREYGDPYYNVHLNSNSTQPEEDVFVDWEKIKTHLRTNRFTAGMYEGIKKKILPSAEQKAVVAEIQAINARKTKLADDIVRINILLPSVDVKHVFGGIATALDFYQELVGASDCMKRIIVTDASVSEDSMIALPDYHIVDAMDDKVSDYQIVPMADRAEKTLAVSEKDLFVATGWWTAYTIADVIRWQQEMYPRKQKCNPLIYMVQDYEPGFYPWSSRYLMADSTYQMEIPTIAVINSQELKDFLEGKSYHFYRSFCFAPVLNLELKKYLLEYAEKKPDRKKQVLVYGRPSVDRNAFALVVNALKRWIQIQEDIEEWTILSAGESFEDIVLGKGKVLHSIGKVSLAEYAGVMAETKVAVSLMVSPHPSYPPLEMSSFGVKVITNHYANKDLSGFNENIISLSNCSAVNIANQISELCRAGDGEYQTDSAYVKNADSGQLRKIAEEIRVLLFDELMS